MVFITLLLIASSIAIEIYLVGKIPWLLRFLERFALAALIFSGVLSFALGTLFGAAGVMVFVAALVSTFAAQPYYRAKRAGIIDAYHVRYEAFKASIQAQKDLWARRWNQTMQIVRFIWHVVIFPFTVYLWILDHIHQGVAFFASTKERLRMLLHRS